MITSSSPPLILTNLPISLARQPAAPNVMLTEPPTGVAALKVLVVCGEPFSDHVGRLVPLNALTTSTVAMV
ncbi:hypothetical protein O6474_23815, partial [Salmonella enterica subsp. enterica]